MKLQAVVDTIRRERRSCNPSLRVFKRPGIVRGPRIAVIRRTWPTKRSQTISAVGRPACDPRYLAVVSRPEKSVTAPHIRRTALSRSGIACAALLITKSVIAGGKGVFCRREGEASDT